MKNFFEVHRQDFFHIVIIIAAVLALRLVTNAVIRWLVKIQTRKFTVKPTKAIPLIRRILNTLWIVLGLMAVSYIFDDGENVSRISNNFKIAIYLGVVATVTLVVASSLNIWFKLHIEKKIEQQQDPTSIKFLRYVVLASIYFVGALFCLLAFPSLRGISQTALGGAGVLALIAGLAAQEALANVIGGIFIITFKPFRIGDLIEIDTTILGTVTDITLRHTVIRNYKNGMIVIPNSIVNKEKIVNFDIGEKKSCEFIDIGISYDSDIDVAKKIMQEECENHPLIYDNRTAADKRNNLPLVKTGVISLNDSSVQIRAWAWAKSYVDATALKRDVLESIKKRFDKEGIEIPFPHRTIVIKDQRSKSDNQE